VSKDYYNFEKSRFIIIPIPYDLSSTYGSGARKGPSAIIEASLNMELYDEELNIEPYLSGIYTMDHIEISSAGPEVMMKRVSEVVDHILKSNKFPIVLGGDHSITIGIVKAFENRYKNLSILQLDAHADLRDSYQDTKYGHASVGRRISESFPLTIVGVRSISIEETKYLDKINIFWARDIIESKVSIPDIIMNLSDKVYITIDIDVFDPSIVPSVGTPEPGGLSWRQILNIVSEVASKKNIVGFDVVELSPIPGIIHPDFLSARLIYRIIGYIIINQKKEEGGGCN
jgi:agmatinase